MQEIFTHQEPPSNPKLDAIAEQIKLNENTLYDMNLEFENVADELSNARFIDFDLCETVLDTYTRKIQILAEETDDIREYYEKVDA